jgi:multiple antibiotic resistance protein
MTDFLWQAFATLLVIIDPFAVVPVYIGLTQYENVPTKRFIARKACFIGLILLLSFAFLGERLLTVLNISESAFRIAGGFLLLLAAIEMVMARNIGFRASSERESGITAHGQDVAVYPLAIPLLAGPGAFTSLVILMGQAKEISIHAEMGVVFLVVTVLVITYTCLRLSEVIMAVLGTTGTNVLTRVFGIILAGLAFQNIITGVIAVLRSV